MADVKFEARQADWNFLLLQLDNSTLLKICCYLSTCDQYCLSKVHYRLSYIIKREWKANLRCLFINFTYIRLTRPKSIFKEFMAAVQPYPVQFRMADITVDAFEDINDCVFPKVDHVNFIAHPEFNLVKYKDEPAKMERCRPFTDEHIISLARMFPKLTRLALHNCFITGRHISKIKTLKCIHLNNCTTLEKDGLREIFENNELTTFDNFSNSECPWANLTDAKLCSTLIFMKLQYHGDYENYAREIITMPQLLYLHVLDEYKHCKILEQIVKHRVRNIKRLKFSGPVYGLAKFFEHITNIDELEELMLQYCSDYKTESFDSNILCKASIKLQNLRVLHMQATHVDNEVGLLKIVENCPNLIVLDITGTRLDKSFALKVLAILARQDTRTFPLIIWTRGSRITLSDIKSIKSKRMLLDYFSCLPYYRFDILRVEFGDLR